MARVRDSSEGNPLFNEDSTHDEIWQWFRRKHAGAYSEDQLRQIHLKWKRIAKEVRWPK